MFACGMQDILVKFEKSKTFGDYQHVPILAAFFGLTYVDMFGTASKLIIGKKSMKRGQTSENREPGGIRKRTRTRIGVQELAMLSDQVLIRLDVEDLIRCKSVCKSWLTFISHPRFIKTHLNYSYNVDRNNNPYGHRRVDMGMKIPMFYTYMHDYKHSCYVIGSSNGLVCISYSNYEIVIANPCTRVETKLPQIPGYTPSSYWAFCCGFGYDSSTDDYKVVVGLKKSEYLTSFMMLGLRSSVWKVIGEKKYMFNSRIGTLCNGALHWLMFPQNHHTSNSNSNNNSNCNSNKNRKAMILSFDLCQHTFKEMPPPDDDPLYQSLDKNSMTLGIMGECLCILERVSFIHPHHNIWIMNKYDVKEPWGIVGAHDCGKDAQPQHLLRSLECVEYRRDDLFTRPYIRMCKNCFETDTPVFVRSLVSPHAPFFNC
ncbi:hypothetical protein QVD17_29321 [Tagetes erecta]|uniref:F-box domain-containing protein n=1 Tax=Tagetes erecta TaxID=13708 RepID=A0AAD8KBR3_TARER|nr:hypothetical protein QVD17_29321 [Tagetes erecta]